MHPRSRVAGYRRWIDALLLVLLVPTCLHWGLGGAHADPDGKADQVIALWLAETAGR